MEPKEILEDMGLSSQEINDALEIMDYALDYDEFEEQFAAEFHCGAADKAWALMRGSW